jgi:hypothetical protein
VGWLRAHWVAPVAALGGLVVGGAAGGLAFPSTTTVRSERSTVSTVVRTVTATTTTAPQPVDRVVSCGNHRSGFIYDVSARNLTCAEASDVLDHFRNGHLSGWACTSLGPIGRDIGYRCTQGNQALRFSYGE